MKNAKDIQLKTWFELEGEKYLKVGSIGDMVLAAPIDELDLEMMILSTTLVEPTRIYGRIMKK